ncbi:MAG TPA: DUF3465 domain-containing protein [Steroidobacteraceae bacterium]|jgi:hypothetical protein
MKKLLLVGLVLAAIVQLAQHREFFGENAPGPARTSTTTAATPGDSQGAQTLAEAFEQRRSNVRVTAAGAVIRILADDVQGSRHQRFLVRADSGQTILIAHNIDLAPRVEELRPGDRVEFSGEYEWNNKGGVVHWTHRDPSGRHVAGWISHGGKRYE